MGKLKGSRGGRRDRMAANRNCFFGVLSFSFLSGWHWLRYSRCRLTAFLRVLTRDWAMGRNGSQDRTPDLFSTGRLDGSPSNNPPETPPGRPSRRAALPKDLPRAIRYLEDEELDWLLRTTIHEAKRRGRPMPMAEASPTNTLARLVRANS
jgi:hypothetical protein